MLAEHERRGDLAVRQAGRDESQNLGLARAEGGVAVHLARGGVPQEPDERAAQRPLVVQPRQVCVAVERDEPRVGEKPSDLAAVRDRDGPVPAAVEHERRGLDGREVSACVRRQVELEERPCHVRRRRVALVPAHRLDRAAVRLGQDQAGEHLGRERPVRPHEVDDGAPRRLGHVRPRGIAPEEDEPLDALGRDARESGGCDAGAGAREERHAVPAARVDHGGERAHLRLDGRCAHPVPVREARAEPVVAHDPMRPGELLEEHPGVRILPLFLEVRHPAPAEEQRRALTDGRVCDPPAVELAEANLLLH